MTNNNCCYKTYNSKYPAKLNVEMIDCLIGFSKTTKIYLTFINIQIQPWIFLHFA